MENFCKVCVLQFYKAFKKDQQNIACIYYMNITCINYINYHSSLCLAIFWTFPWQRTVTVFILNFYCRGEKTMFSNSKSEIWHINLNSPGRNTFFKYLKISKLYYDMINQITPDQNNFSRNLNLKFVKWLEKSHPMATQKLYLSKNFLSFIGPSPCQSCYTLTYTLYLRWLDI